MFTNLTHCAHVFQFYQHVEQKGEMEMLSREENHKLINLSESTSFIKLGAFQVNILVLFHYTGAGGKDANNATNA